MSSSTGGAVWAERLLRRRIRGSLSEWSTLALTPQGLVPARHHQVVIKELEGLAAGRWDRLMLLLPPGSAKSTYTFQDNWTGVDVLVPAASVVDWIGTWGGWQAVAFPLADYLAPTGDGGLVLRSEAGDVAVRPAGHGVVRVSSDAEPVGFASLLGRGTPVGMVVAPVGSDYRNLDGGVGTTLWIKRSGLDASGWYALA